MSLKDLLFGFQGRIRRSQWWAVQLSLLGVVVVLLLLIGALGAAISGSQTGRVVSEASLLLSLVLVVPAISWINLATGVKRLHDQGSSGWVMLLTYIPGIGGIFGLLRLGCVDGTPRRNQYGPSPKHPESEAEAFA